LFSSPSRVLLLLLLHLFAHRSVLVFPSHFGCLSLVDFVVATALRGRAALRLDCLLWLSLFLSRWSLALLHSLWLWIFACGSIISLVVSLVGVLQFALVVVPFPGSFILSPPLVIIHYSHPLFHKVRSWGWREVVGEFSSALLSSTSV